MSQSSTSCSPPPSVRPTTSQTIDEPGDTQAVPLLTPQQAPRLRAPLQVQDEPTTDVKPFRSFLRSVGLKILTAGRYHKNTQRKTSPVETQKVIVNQSRRIALARAGVHIFPIVITLFLLLLNSLTLLNGPTITVSALFGLQVAAKLHELTIIGSLTSVVLDLLHYHLVHEGINLGLLGSGLTVASPSWLWSIDFISGFRTSISTYPRVQFKGLSLKSIFSRLLRSKLFLFVFLISATTLATTVGPASALLLIPIQLWVPSTSTDFYVAGTEDVLWPSTLGLNHTGPAICSTSPLPIEIASCLNGSFRVLVSLMSYLSPIRPGSQLHVPGGSAWLVPPARLVSLNIPVVSLNFTRGDPDTWAVSPHQAVASHVDYLNKCSEAAFGLARGWKRRLADFGSSHLDVTTGGKFPVVRTVCSDPTAVHGPSTELSFPSLNEHQFWRPQIFNGTGPMVTLNTTTLNLTDWDALLSNATTDQQARARWIPLPQTLESGSAAMTYLAKNRTTTYAYACVIDARWATGQTMQTDRTVLWAWESQAGFQPFDTRSSPPDYTFQRPAMFDPRQAPFYSHPVRIEQPWLDALTPEMPEASLPGNGLVMNTFEALLNHSVQLANPNSMVAGERHATVLLEYVTTLFFIEAMSRVGLSHQLALPSDHVLREDLQSHPITDDSFIGGKMLYDRRDPGTPFTLAHYQQYKYGTVWALAQTGQYIGVTILCLHILVAFIHIGVLCWTKRSSASWDSINELIVLAYNSATRPNAFENCSSGIEFSKTLEKRVRVGTRKRFDGREQAELVICDEEDSAGTIVPGKKYS